MDFKSATMIGCFSLLDFLRHCELEFKDFCFYYLKSVFIIVSYIFGGLYNEYFCISLKMLKLHAEKRCA